MTKDLENIEKTKVAINDVDKEVEKIKRMKIQFKLYLESHPQNVDVLQLVQGLEIQYKQLLKAKMILKAHLEEMDEK